MENNKNSLMRYREFFRLFLRLLRQRARFFAPFALRFFAPLENDNNAHFAHSDNARAPRW